jgi:hypothetical protein
VGDEESSRQRDPVVVLGRLNFIQMQELHEAKRTVDAGPAEHLAVLGRDEPLKQ